MPGLSDHCPGDKLLPDIAMERSYKSIVIVQEILADPNIPPSPPPPLDADQPAGAWPRRASGRWRLPD